mmetsp:Transcript_1012/g.1431  ORF Transcript_1012/g.1431 Transcript_1012/m.1431 type:complete len:185 (-) Transcript_1012:21-575(-)
MRSRVGRHLRRIMNTRSVLTHVTDENMPTMKSVTDKAVTKRTAIATSSVYLPPAVVTGVKAHGSKGDIESSKGPVFATAIIAGTMAVKKTSDMIPFCHPLPIESCSIDINLDESARDGSARAQIKCTVEVTSKTGVEMEALAGASVSALTIYDMLKALSQQMVIEDTKLLVKTGGKSDYKTADK